MTAPAFDLQRLHSDIDAKRQRQDLNWSALSREVRVAASTIRRYAHARDAEAEADGVLALIQWLDEAPEDYITNNSTTPAKLPPAEHGQVRVDMNRVAEATRDPRGANGRTRTTIQRLVEAAQHAGQSVVSLTRLSEL